MKGIRRVGMGGIRFQEPCWKVQGKRRATLAGGHALGAAFVSRGGIERGRTGRLGASVASYAGCGIAEVCVPGIISSTSKHAQGWYVCCVGGAETLSMALVGLLVRVGRYWLK
jgi:hypothetical protein